MTTQPSPEEARYGGPTHDEPMQAPTVFRDDLLSGQAWDEFWPLGKPAPFRIED